MDKEDNFYSLFKIGLLMFTAVLLSIVSNAFWPAENTPIHQTPLSVTYHNKESSSTKIRYKYSLSYTPANGEVEANIDETKPLFVLQDDKGNILTSQYPSSNPDSITPDVSEFITLKPDETTVMNIVVQVDETAEPLRDKILFETFIVVEELLEGKWSPVFQVRQLERGDYFRLERLPIEKFN